MEVPEELRKELVQYQTMQAQLSALQNQISGLKLEMDILKEARKRVEEAQGDIYRAVGPILVKEDKESVMKWIDERLEILKVKITSLDKKAKALENTLLQLKKKIESELQAIQSGGAASG